MEPFRASYVSMYRNISEYALLFIAEGLKSGPLFSSVSDCLGRSGCFQRTSDLLKFNTKSISKWLRKAALFGGDFLAFSPNCYWTIRLLERSITFQFVPGKTRQNRTVFLEYPQWHLSRDWKGRYERDRTSQSRQNKAKPHSFFWVFPLAFESILRGTIAPDLHRAAVEIVSEIAMLSGGDVRYRLLGKVEVLRQIVAPSRGATWA